MAFMIVLLLAYLGNVFLRKEGFSDVSRNVIMIIAIFTMMHFIGL